MWVFNIVVPKKFWLPFGTSIWRFWLPDRNFACPGTSGRRFARPEVIIAVISSFKVCMVNNKISLIL